MVMILTGLRLGCPATENGTCVCVAEGSARAVGVRELSGGGCRGSLSRSPWAVTRRWRADRGPVGRRHGPRKAGLGADRPVIGAPMDRSWQPESCRAGLRRAHGRLRALPTGGAGADAASVAADRLTGDNKIAATPSDCNFGWEAQHRWVSTRGSVSPAAVGWPRWDPCVSAAEGRRRTAGRRELSGGVWGAGDPLGLRARRPDGSRPQAARQKGAYRKSAPSRIEHHGKGIGPASSPRRLSFTGLLRLSQHPSSVELEGRPADLVFRARERPLFGLRKTERSDYP